MQHKELVLDSRARYEAPQSELLSMVGESNFLASAHPEGWEYGDYEM